MFLSKNKKNNVYLCKLQFYYIKVGLNGIKINRHVLLMNDIMQIHALTENVILLVFSSIQLFCFYFMMFLQLYLRENKLK